MHAFANESGWPRCRRRRPHVPAFPSAGENVHDPSNRGSHRELRQAESTAPTFCTVSVGAIVTIVRLDPGSATTTQSAAGQ
ncbi:MAG: hypothetical protein D6725_12615 [Planctomycetota bacterium]|nr:MAG: hypothetical protein D6725_12615 [Planctomycetota bacterium]